MTRPAPAAPHLHLSALVVDRYQAEGSTDEKSHWTEVGRAFAHADGLGFNLQVRPNISVSNTVVLRSPKLEHGQIGPLRPESMSAPYLTASVVENYTSSDGLEERAQWTEVGRAFPNSDGQGFNLVLRKQLSVSGTIVLRAPRAKTAQAPQDAAHSFR